MDYNGLTHYKWLNHRNVDRNHLRSWLKDILFLSMDTIRASPGEDSIIEYGGLNVHDDAIAASQCTKISTNENVQKDTRIVTTAFAAVFMLACMSGDLRRGGTPPTSISLRKCPKTVDMIIAWMVDYSHEMSFVEYSRSIIGV
jgi:hypothetical protein